MFDGLENEILGPVLVGGTVWLLRDRIHYEIDRVATHLGIRVENNIRDTVEITTWPTGVINPQTGNEFREIRFREKLRDTKVENILRHSALLKTQVNKAFTYAQMLPGESNLAFQWRRAVSFVKGEHLPIGENFILLLNLTHVIPKESFRKYMDEFEGAYRGSWGAAFDRDELQSCGGLSTRDYREEEYILPLLVMDPHNYQMRVIIIPEMALTDPSYYPSAADCVVRLMPGKPVPEEAKPENGGYHFINDLGTFYRAPAIPRIHRLIEKVSVARKLVQKIHENPELFNFAAAIPTNRIVHVPQPALPAPVQSAE